MKNKFLKTDEKLDQSISEFHTNKYLDKIKIGLLLSISFITIIEFVIFFLIKTGLLGPTLSNEFISSRWTPDKNYIERYLINLNLFNWIIYGVYYILNMVLDYENRKKLTCAVFIIITTLYAFIHKGFVHLSILYVIPIIFACPLGRKYQSATFIISLLMTLVYSIYHYNLMDSEYGFLIGLISFTSFTAIVITHLICKCVYSSFVRALQDIKQYSTLSTKLVDEIEHDYVTGALSKAALNKEVAQKGHFTSLAFIDLDNFKSINDTKGHSAGDNVLINLVKSFQNKNVKIYRYGGDEFVALSNLKVYDLYAKILQIKTNFSNTCKKQLNCDATFSAGIKTVSPDKNIDQIIKEADNIMYISKKNGKDQITVEE